jgi:uncharacterized Zn finger protein (UPF0148 family)
MYGGVMKDKTCKVCKRKYTPYRAMQIACGSVCGYKYAQTQQEKKRKAEEKEERKNIREAKKKLKTRGELLKEAQAEFNKYIRLRDDKAPCISCQRHHRGQYHAGHYRSVGANPELRFNENNCHKQCSACNNYLSGNLINYRINLIKKIGLDAVEELEGWHEPIKLTREDIIDLKKTYRALVNELRAGIVN